MKKVLTIFMLAFSLLVLLNVVGYSVSYAQNINENVSVTRDDKGVWFIKAGSLYDSFEAMGYCVAKDRLWQAEVYRRSGRGTLSEIFGMEQLELDIFIRTRGYTEEELQAGFNALDDKYKTIISAYVSGFNRRIAEIHSDPSLLPFEFVALGASLGKPFIPEDWKETDVLAWAVLLMRQFDPEALTTGQIENLALLTTLTTNFPYEGYAMFSDLRWNNDPDAQTMIPEGNYLKKHYYFMDKLKLHPGFNTIIQNLNNHHKKIIKKLKKLNAYVGIGSYAWVVSGQKTVSGNSILYSGPQMGFSAPAPVLEGSIEAPGYKVSGMAIAGIPGIIVGRTPHHAWSMQVGHAHTVDYYFENPSVITIPNRIETISVAGFPDFSLPVYRTNHGPVIYISNDNDTVISWKYSQWGFEFDFLEAIFGLGSANNMKQFGEAVERIPTSLHICYADRNNNIGYWMSGRDPIRPENINPWLPLSGDGTQEWPEPVTLKPRPHDSNPRQGFYGGWNNKSMKDYDNNPLDIFQYGLFHRGHVIQDFLSMPKNLNFDEIRDLALNIATTDSFGRGGNTWKSVAKYFKSAVRENSSQYEKYLTLLDEWNGHFVAGDESQWVSGSTRADAWILQNEWIKEVIRLTFQDELPFYFIEGLDAETKDRHLYVLFNVLLHALAGQSSGVVNQYYWFQDKAGTGIPQTAEGIIVTALKNVLTTLGEQPWGINSRGNIVYNHPILGTMEEKVTPFAQRSTYAQCVEMDHTGPVRIESMFQLGESGNITADYRNGNLVPIFDEHFFSMHDSFNNFTHRPFPLFKKTNKHFE